MKSREMERRRLAGLGLLLALTILTTAAPAVVYVSPSGDDGAAGDSWQNAYATVQNAMDNVGPDNTVWVRKGIYTLTNHLIAPADITVLGGFNGDETSASQADPWTNLTILAQTNTNKRVLFVNNAIDNTTFDGLVFALGNVTGGGDGGGLWYRNSTGHALSRCFIVYNDAGDQGGGVEALTADVRVTNCVFAGNVAYDLGGGIHLTAAAGLYPETIIENCVFSGNMTTRPSSGAPPGGSAIYPNHGVLVEVNNCVLANNHSMARGVIHSRGVPLQETTCTVQNTIFKNNTHNGFTLNFLQGAGELRRVKCIFDGNDHDVRGGTLWGSDIDADPMFRGNKTGTWATVESSTLMSTMTVAGSPFAPDALVGMVVDPNIEPSSNTKRHTICIANTANQVTIIGDGDGAAAGSTYEFFDYRLGPLSPGLNVGREIPDIPATDLADNPREVGTIDIGAYEYQSANPVLYVDASAPDGGSGTDWETAMNDIETAFAALSGSQVDDIRVAGGVYPITAQLAMQSDLTVLGGYPTGGGGDAERDPFANPTVIAQTTDPQRVVSFSGGLTDLTVDGLIFANGRLDSGDGAGAYCINLDASNTIRNCGFINNKNRSLAAGGVFCNNTEATFDRCVFAGNHCTDRGGAIYCGGGGGITVNSSLFSGNLVHDGLENHTRGGSCLYGSGGGDVSITNCTMVNNSCHTAMNGVIQVRVLPMTVALRNCVISGNTQGNSLLRQAQSAVITRYVNLFNDNTGSNLEGTLDGSGSDITDAPLFVGGPTGTWDSVSTDTLVSTLTATGTPFADMDLAGYLINPNALAGNVQPLHTMVLSNTDSTVIVIGDGYGVADGAPFEVFNYRIADTASPAIDAGQAVSVDYDLDGNPRSAPLDYSGGAAAPDLGAYEIMPSAGSGPASGVETWTRY